jgi:hypothetical protein
MIKLYNKLSNFFSQDMVVVNNNCILNITDDTTNDVSNNITNDITNDISNNISSTQLVIICDANDTGRDEQYNSSSKKKIFNNSKNEVVKTDSLVKADSLVNTDSLVKAVTKETRINSIFEIKNLKSFIFSDLGTSKQ